MSVFTTKDLHQIQKRGSDTASVKEQIRTFERGFDFLRLDRAATPSDGLMQLSESEQAQMRDFYDNSIQSLRVLKFVPASGAASRMFKDLFAFMESYDGTEAAYEQLVNDPELKKVYKFFKKLNHFAFYEGLRKQFGEDEKALEESILRREYSKVLQKLLTEDGLNYGNLPKGLLAFHQYEDSTRTPVEEHLVEGAAHARSRNGKVYLHFTVSPEHRELFRQLIEQVREHYESRFGLQYQITFSEQKASTDTIAVDMDNKPFRLASGELLFRPGGHGALIENLNEMEADVIFLKNIDNVVPERIQEETILWKKIIGGVLLSQKEKIDGYLTALEKPEALSDETLTEITDYLAHTLCVSPPEDFASADREQQIMYLASKLNRPLRVCGMVKNEGEPGGGPFWVEQADGSCDLQIVESAQIDTADPKQKEIHQSLTHFNPVDVVVATKNYKGRKYDLSQYVDPKTGFITQKSKEGRDLKALELPGLWNGAMADWNTLFVEVPLITFNPVKTVNDLLRDQHQPERK